MQVKITDWILSHWRVRDVMREKTNHMTTTNYTQKSWEQTQEKDKPLDTTLLEKYFPTEASRVFYHRPTRGNIN